MNKKASFIIPKVIIKEASERERKQAITSLLHKSFLQDRPHLLEEIMLMPNVRREAGRLSGLAEAGGLDQPLTVKNPLTSRTVNSLIGAIIGGIVGRGPGAAIGTLGGYGYDTVKSVKDRTNLRNELSLQNAKDNKFDKGIRQGNILASLVSGMHQRGKTDAFEAINQGKTKFDGNKLQSWVEGIQAGTLGATGPITAPMAMALSIKDFIDANQARAK